MSSEKTAPSRRSARRHQLHGLQGGGVAVQQVAAGRARRAPCAQPPQRGPGGGGWQGGYADGYDDEGGQAPGAARCAMSAEGLGELRWECTS